MDLILWRHADAEDGVPDLQRALTGKGRRQAELTAAWLKPRLPEGTRVLVSPARRAQQTAKPLGLRYETVDALAPGADAATVLAAVGWPDAQNPVLAVGHQPTLGQIAALLLAGAEAGWIIKKSAVWWLSNRVRKGEAQVVLRAAISPEFLEPG